VEVVESPFAVGDLGEVIKFFLVVKSQAVSSVFLLGTENLVREGEV